MPIIDVKLFEGRLTAETSPVLIEKFTDVLVDVFGEGIRQYTTVLLSEVAPQHWGHNGKPYG